MRTGKRLFSALLALAAVLALFRLCPEPISGWARPEGLPRSLAPSILRQIRTAASHIESLQDRDAAEVRLIAQGYPVMDTNGPYPEYLANSGRLKEFAAGRRNSFGYFHLLENDALRSVFFFRQGQELGFFCADVQWTEGRLSLKSASCQPLYEMELADWNVFYYRLYPAGDPHYVDYTPICLDPPDKDAWDLIYRYIQPVGYQMVNLFLQDWQEDSWGKLSFPDLLESLYQMQTGARLPWETFPAQGDPLRRMVPGELFEQTILPYFSISREELRQRCGYDPEQDRYPWRPVRGDELVSWGYPMCEPHLSQVRENSDGTLTLEVDVWSSELKTNRLFCHQVTVRPLGGNGFQYVSNQVSYIADRGLPMAKPRFSLDF